jgi:hypothetical protein
MDTTVNVAMPEPPGNECRMGWNTYVGAIVRHGRHYFYLQRINDELSGPHPVLVGIGERLGLYASEAEARAAAELLEEQVEAKTPYVEDLDAVHRWAVDPRADTIDNTLLMMGWHTLADLGVLEQMPVELDPSAPEYALSEIGDKIHIGNYMATYPDAPFETPVWSPAEVSLLAATLLRGLDGLDVLLQAGSTSPQRTS